MKGSSSKEAHVTIGQSNVIAINTISNGDAKLQTNTWNHVYLRVCTRTLIVYSFYGSLKRVAYCFCTCWLGGGI